MTKRKYVQILQIDPSKSTASKVLDLLSKSDYAMIIDNNVDNKRKTLKMIDTWVSNAPVKDECYYISMIQYIKASRYHWFNQSDLKPVRAKDVIYMLEH